MADNIFTTRPARSCRGGGAGRDVPANRRRWPELLFCHFIAARAEKLLEIKNGFGQNGRERSTRGRLSGDSQ
jgi:hypothetical protein